MNSSTGNLKIIPLLKPINTITFNSVGNVLYYICLEYTDEDSTLNFFKFLCNSEKEQKICSLTLSKDHYITKNPNQLVDDVIFYGISDRYAEFIKKADTLALYKSWGGPY